MRPENFSYLCTLVKQRSGLSLGADKAYLLESRLLPISKTFGYHSIDFLCDALKSDKNIALTSKVVEAMTTNETSFFRDKKPFEQFQNLVLPHVLRAKAREKKIRIWSAACSTGQEAYSLAMILDQEKAKMPGWSVEIIGTDISTDALTRAKSGIYTQFEVQRGTTAQSINKHFKEVNGEWHISPEIKSRAEFHHANLLEDLSRFGCFDIIFCRNVLIYFDMATKASVLQKLRKQIHSHGFLFLGGAETVLGIDGSFRPMPEERGIYTPC